MSPWTVLTPLPPSLPPSLHWPARAERRSLGQYTMTPSADGQAMEGCYNGYPEDWRKAQFVRAHTAEELEQIKSMTAAAHGSCGSGCGHSH